MTVLEYKINIKPTTVVHGSCSEFKPNHWIMQSATQTKAVAGCSKQKSIVMIVRFKRRYLCYGIVCFELLSRELNCAIESICGPMHLELSFMYESLSLSHTRICNTLLSAYMLKLQTFLPLRLPTAVHGKVYPSSVKRGNFQERGSDLIPTW